jgi:hypothetical protein
MDAAMSSAITHLTAAVPALDADTAKAALEAAVPGPDARHGSSRR